jgi:hypothetical protein
MGRGYSMEGSKEKCGNNFTGNLKGSDVLHVDYQGRDESIILSRVKRLGTVFGLVICCWSSTAQPFFGSSPTELTTIIYCLRFETPPDLEGQVPVLISPRNRVAHSQNQSCITNDVSRPGYLGVRHSSVNCDQASYLVINFRQLRVYCSAAPSLIRGWVYSFHLQGEEKWWTVTVRLTTVWRTLLEGGCGNEAWGGCSVVIKGRPTGSAMKKGVGGGGGSQDLNTAPNGQTQYPRGRCSTYLSSCYGDFLMEQMRGFHDLLRQDPTSLFMLLGWSSVSMASLTMWPM